MQQGKAVMAPGRGNPPEGPATRLRMRLRVDVASAIRIGDRLETAVLRSILAEVDNAEAVPIGNLHAKYELKKFGDKSVEVSRKTLTTQELERLLTRERDARLTAAGQIEAFARTEEAGMLRAQAAIISRYFGL